MKNYPNKILLLIMITIPLFFSCSSSSDSSSNNSNPIPTDITIGSQVWASKNLDVDHYRNGDPIPQVTSPSQFITLTSGAWCYYNNDPANGAIYGKLYNWYAVNDTRGLAPLGYHIPNDTEWTALFTNLGGLSIAGGAMKEEGTSHWIIPNTGATNSSGFTALPGGILDAVTANYFINLNRAATWWSTNQATQQDNTSNYLLYAHGAGVTSVTTQAYLPLLPYKTRGLSVRCIKD